MADLSVRELLDLIDLDGEKVEESRGRQAAASNGRADYLPIVFALDVPEARVDVDYMDEFNSDEDMLRRQLSAVVCLLRSGSDAAPSVRANLGTGFLATLAGLEQEHFPDKMPWLKEHLEPEKLVELKVEDVDIAEAGEMPRCLRFLRRAREVLPPWIDIYLPDTQGPCDLAHLLVGDRLFYLPHDDPELTHAVMSKATELYVRASLLIKDALAQPLECCPHWGRYYMEGLGVRICEDTTTLFGPDMLQRFILPCTRRAAAACGGAFVHYCGKNPHLLRLLIEEAPEVRGLNWGDPQMHDPAEVLPQLIERGKFYVGTLARLDGEPLEGYFSRVLAPVRDARRGLIFSPELRPEERRRASEVCDLWRRLQDEGASHLS